jgi:hypothetical protein
VLYIRVLSGQSDEKVRDTLPEQQLFHLKTGNTSEGSNYFPELKSVVSHTAHHRNSCKHWDFLDTFCYFQVLSRYSHGLKIG